MTGQHQQELSPSKAFHFAPSYSLRSRFSIIAIVRPGTASTAYGNSAAGSRGGVATLFTAASNRGKKNIKIAAAPSDEPTSRKKNVE